MVKCFNLADRITVLRDGRVVDTLSVDGATISSLIASMVGRNIITAERDFNRQSFDETALEVVGLGRRGAFKDISFQLHAGEVVGIAGLPDSYKDELVEALFGLGKIESGEIRLNGKPVQISSPIDAIHQGMYLIPADRRGAGALLQMTLQDNIVAASLQVVSRAGFFLYNNASSLAKTFFERLDIRATGLRQVMANLSGGNQQKVILGRGLATSPAVLLLHEPTRGIDVGAKAEIYQILHDLAEKGAAILIVSSELPELISQCDRILVMHAGHISGIFQHKVATEEDILACAMGHAEHLV
jgi:ABC-type sugar transport system ATPase subunit